MLHTVIRNPDRDVGSTGERLLSPRVTGRSAVDYQLSTVPEGILRRHLRACWCSSEPSSSWPRVPGHRTAKPLIPGQWRRAGDRLAVGELPKPDALVLHPVVISSPLIYPTLQAPSSIPVSRNCLMISGSTYLLTVTSSLRPFLLLVLSTKSRAVP